MLTSLLNNWLIYARLNQGISMNQYISWRLHSSVYLGFFQTGPNSFGNAYITIDRARERAKLSEISLEKSVKHILRVFLRVVTNRSRLLKKITANFKPADSYLNTSI